MEERTLLEKLTRLPVRESEAILQYFVRISQNENSEKGFLSSDPRIQQLEAKALRKLSSRRKKS